MSGAPDKSRKRKLAGFILAIVALMAAVAFYFAARSHRFVEGQSLFHSAKLRHVTFTLLPNILTVIEGTSYSHEFSIPGDATNAIVAGEFTVEPRIQAQLNMLVVTSAGFSHWQEYLSAGQTEPGDRNLLYRTGNTGADLFEIKLVPGVYDLIFDYGPPSGPTFSDHYGGLGSPLSRNANTKITLSYDLPQEIR
ncbi:MAG: hypothetical protein ABSG69_06690 [Candidatus Acidiferrum sp.]|jgi:hypothetical protein